MNVLVFFDSRHGQTERIARRLSESLADLGLDARVVDLRSREARRVDFHNVHAVVLGASVQFNRHSGVVRRFVRRHLDILNARPSFFFSVSLAASGDTQEDRDQTQLYVRSFLNQTAWYPTLSRSFAGCLAYTRYWWLLRRIMRKIAEEHSLPTDTAQDHELTDWDEVAGFARSIQTVIEPGRAPVGTRV